MERDVRNRKRRRKYPDVYPVQINPKWGQREQDMHVVEKRPKKRSRKTEERKVT